MGEEQKPNNVKKGGFRIGAGRKKNISALGEKEANKVQRGLMGMSRLMMRNLREDLGSSDPKIRQLATFKMLDKVAPEKLEVKDSTDGVTTEKLRDGVIGLLLASIAARNRIGGKEPVEGTTCTIIRQPSEDGGVQGNETGGLLPAAPEAVIVPSEPEKEKDILRG